MLRHYRIRSLIYLGFAVLSLIVISLATVSIVGVCKFRKLTRDIRLRATELPLVADLSHEVNSLRSTLWQCRSRSIQPGQLNRMQLEQLQLRDRFVQDLRTVAIALDRYRTQLAIPDEGDPRIVDTSDERRLVQLMQHGLDRMYGLINSRSLDFGNYKILLELEDELELLQSRVSSLPSLLNDRMNRFASEARTEYHALIAMATLTGVCGMALLVATVLILNSGILRPLRKLIRSSRIVADGRYDFRIDGGGCSEMVSLADAFNHMTESFRQISENLTQQVEARSREVIRSEQLASVGMLAAGVAHEINNPLASIAWSAEALQSRMEDLQEGQPAESAALAEITPVAMKYLKRIQDEAFRCKKITTGLLDFSRLGDARKSRTDIRQIVISVVEMVQTLGRYGQRKVELDAQHAVWCTVHPQEIRQVVLNLLTNALDSTGVDGLVRISLTELAGEAVVEVTDNGCGMSAEVMQNLFEPFFTRRRDGQGTGLGLAIAWRIIDEHGGQIHVASDGPGAGSTFQLCLPLDQARPLNSQPRQLMEQDNEELRPAA